MGSWAGGPLRPLLEVLRGSPVDDLFNPLLKSPSPRETFRCAELLVAAGPSCRRTCSPICYRGSSWEVWTAPLQRGSVGPQPVRVRTACPLSRARGQGQHMTSFRGPCIPEPASRGTCQAARRSAHGPR